MAGLALADIDAVFITHEHGDHIGCVHALALRYRIPVWMSRGTYLAVGMLDFDGLLQIARDGQNIDLGGLQIRPFTVPHDAREPLQLTCSDGSSKLGILTDLGHATPHVIAQLEGCDALLLECNHDSDMLVKSLYPPFLKQRVAGPYGHLSNQAAASVARAVCHSQLKHLVAAHLSLQNNRPDLVRSAVSTALDCGNDDIVVADAITGTPWLQL